MLKFTQPLKQILFHKKITLHFSNFKLIECEELNDLLKKNANIKLLHPYMSPQKSSEIQI